MLPHLWGLFVVISGFIAKCGPGAGNRAVQEQMRLYLASKTEVLLLAAGQFFLQGSLLNELQRSLESMQESLSSVKESLGNVQEAVDDLQLSIPMRIREEALKISQALAADLTRALSEVRRQVADTAFSTFSSLQADVVQFVETSLVVPIRSGYASNAHSSPLFGLYLPADATILGYHITPTTLVLLSLMGFATMSIAVLSALLLVLKDRTQANMSGTAEIRHCPSHNDRAIALEADEDYPNPTRDSRATEDNLLTLHHHAGGSEDGPMSMPEISNPTSPTILSNTVIPAVTDMNAVISPCGPSVKAREDTVATLCDLQDSGVDVRETHLSEEVSDLSTILPRVSVAVKTQANEDSEAAQNPDVIARSDSSSPLQSRVHGDTGSSLQVVAGTTAGTPPGHGASAGLGAPLAVAHAKASTDHAVREANVGNAGGGNNAQIETQPIVTFPAEDATVLPEWVMAWRRSPAHNNPELCLTFRRGQIIRVLAGKPGGRWWIGEVEDGSRGHFPPTYVDVLVEPQTDAAPPVPVIVVRPPTPDCTVDSIAQPGRRVLRDIGNDI